MDEPPEFTKHAKDRWAERFPTLDKHVEWYMSRRVGKNLRRKIRAACPMMAKVMFGRTFRGYYYTVSPKGVIFVVGSSSMFSWPAVITVLNRHELEDHAAKIRT